MSLGRRTAPALLGAIVWAFGGVGDLHGTQQINIVWDTVSPARDGDLTRPDEGFRLGEPTTTLAVLTLAGALAVPFDESIRTWFQSGSFQDSHTATRTSDVLSQLGGYGPIAFGGATYAVATLLDRERLADASFHVTQGVVVALGSTMIVKALVGRQRPYTGLGNLSFEPGDGTEARDLRSFPSGHATTIFALAAGLTSEVGHWWPGHARTVGVVSYPIAGLTALSRLFDDQHWASDVLVGAGVGTFLGTWLSRRNHRDETTGGGTSAVQLTPAADGGFHLGWEWRF